MTGFVCVFDRSGAPIERGLLTRLAEPLEIYGHGLASVCNDHQGIAIRHRGRDTLNESFGPVTDPGTGITLALAGQLGLPESLEVGQTRGNLSPLPISAKQALEAYLQMGHSFLSGASGSFALVILDPRRTELTVARSHLGGLKLYYYLDHRWLIAASEPAAILRHPAVGSDVDEGAIARFLGFQFSHTTSSFFREIRELPPAQWLRVTPDRFQSGQYWSFRNRRDVRKWPREKICADFIEQLRRSVAIQTSGMDPERIGLSLSGGLDSTAIAALSPPGTLLFSWYFEKMPECDERENIKLVSEHLRRPVHWVLGDGYYPLCGDYVDNFVQVNAPNLNPFADLKRRLYRAARDEGCERVLVGDGGDMLYEAREYWLRDCLTSLQPQAFASLVRTVREAVGRDRFARLTLRRLLPVRHIRSLLGKKRIPWMLEAAHSLLPRDALSPVIPNGSRRYRFDPGAGAKQIELESEERRLFAQCGVERGNPFWYWPLLEMALNLPAYWYHRDGVSKILAREAMKGLLPDRVLNSGRIGTLGSFFLRGIELNRRYISETVFRQPRSDWQRYVRREWVEPYLSEIGRIAFGHTILWRVISYELWYRRLMQ